MSSYICPTCGEAMQRDMMKLYEHTDKHIVEAIKKSHPQWVNDDGYCGKCVDYFKKEMKHADAVVDKKLNPVLANIEMKGILWRMILGVVMFIVAVGLFFVFHSGEYTRQIRLMLFIPFFISMLGFVQSQNQVCVAHGMKGTCSLGQGIKAVADEKIKAQLKARSLKILVISGLLSAILTAGMYFL